MKFFTLTDEQMIAHKPSCSFCGTRDCVTVRASVPLSEHAACTSPYIPFLCHSCANSALFSLAQVLGHNFAPEIGEIASLRAEFEKLQANYKDACARADGLQKEVWALERKVDALRDENRKHETFFKVLQHFVR